MAAISVIEINTEQLDRDIQRLREKLSQTRTHINRLKDRMDAMNKMWEGTANQAVRQRFQRDHQNMLNLCEMLEELIQTLESIRQSYDSCENHVRSAVDALRI